MKSDDGSWFGIDGKEVINQLKGRGEGNGAMYLSVGNHDITGFMYEVGGEAYIQIL